jgi:hypothetical protein
MISTAFIRDCIVDKEDAPDHGAIAQGTSQYGMQTFDQSIFSLFQQGLVSLRGSAALGVERRRVQRLVHDLSEYTAARADRRRHRDRRHDAVAVQRRHEYARTRDRAERRRDGYRSRSGARG